MKKFFEGCLLFILAVLLIYGVDDYFWQRNREKQIEQVIVTMQNSMDKLENFFRENEDDLEYLVTKCVEDNIVIYDTSVETAGVNGKEINVEPEVLFRRDKLLANLPSDIVFYHIRPSEIKLNHKDARFGTLSMKISSPPFTKDPSSYIAGSIGTIELGHTWTVNVATQDYPDYVRARKILEKLENRALSKSGPAE